MCPANCQLIKLERENGKRRKCERDRKRKGTRVGDKKKAKNSIEMTGNQPMLCARYVDASDKEPISFFWGLLLGKSIFA